MKNRQPARRFRPLESSNTRTARGQEARRRREAAAICFDRFFFFEKFRFVPVSSRGTQTDPGGLILVLIVCRSSVLHTYERYFSPSLL
jgi:hypothetical protein